MPMVRPVMDWLSCRLPNFLRNRPDPCFKAGSAGSGISATALSAVAAAAPAASPFKDHSHARTSSHGHGPGGGAGGGGGDLVRADGAAAPPGDQEAPMTKKPSLSAPRQRSAVALDR